MLPRQSIIVLTLGISLCLLLLKDSSVGTRCDSLLTIGRWSSDYNPLNQNLLWQPFDSMIQFYDKPLMSKCLSNRTLYFIGDSTVRQVFWAVAAKHDRERAEQESAAAGKHEDLSYQIEGISLSFLWDPYLNSSQTKEIIGNPMIKHPRETTNPSAKSHVAGIILSTGLWHARYSGQEFASEHRQALDVAARYSPKKNLRQHNVLDGYLAMTPAIILPPPVLNHNWLNPERAATLSSERLSNITENLLEYQERYEIEVAWSARAMTMNNSAAIRSGGLHVTREVAAYQAEVLLNRVCNNVLFSGSKKGSSLPCVRQKPWKFTMKTGLELMMLVFITCYLVKAYQHQSKLLPQRSKAFVLMTSTIFYCWLADRTTVFEKGNKLVDLRIFGFCTAGLLAFSLARLESGAPGLDEGLPLPKGQDVPRSGKKTLLPREITEEWKGWMQIVILLYHYFGMSKVLPVYQAIRVLVASYLFLTGYGHASYFLNAADFSLRRVVKVVVRLNMLTCLLSVVMENNHELYYFPSLATVWFFITLAVFWRPKGRQMLTRELLTRMLAMLTLSFIVAANENLVELIFDLLRRGHGPDINVREFVFRFQLDILAPFAGMCFAVVEDRTSGSGNQAYPRLKGKVGDRMAIVIRVGLSVLGVTIYACVASKFDDKFSYNKWHWILSLLPIAAYIDMRQALWESNNYFAPFLAWVGSISLELFALQYHILLAADTKGLLRLGIFDTPQVKSGLTTKASWTYWLETTMVTVVFFCTSHYCSRATDTLVEWFVHDDEIQRTRGKKLLLLRVLAVSSLLWLTRLLSGADSGDEH